MFVLTWALFGLLALFWTGAAWITAAATQWMAQALASGTAAEAARDLAALPVPEWLKFWIEPEWVQALQSALQWLVDGAGAGLPLVGTAAGWLVPAIWVAWALGLLLLLAGGAGAHMMLRRFARRPAAPMSGQRQLR
jgi:hypothetical protein